jgi:uncharacterized hydrophobic protein (TIGR00271 family)
MFNKILEYFRVFDEKEEPEIVIERITKDSVFKGTNMWVLVFAIFIASLGLNINSTAVIIGAMLISPLMGPIMGIGMGVAINDLHLAKEAIKNFSFAVLVGLITSFIYFSITPLNDAYSELLARTSPTIYDVLIALFGGLAGIVANSSRQKGNVVPGVAIATALMPPLCTAGYGLATFQFNYFFGAIYLFTINTVFIALATFITLKLLKYPIKHLRDAKADKHSLRIIYVITILTIIPSIYFGYEMIKQNKFTHNANLFVESNSSLEGSYLLNKKIDPLKNSITLVYGGKDLSEFQIKKMNEQLEIFGLQETTLIIKQGISSLPDKKESERVTQLSQLLKAKDQLLTKQKKFVDSISTNNEQNTQLLSELKINYPDIDGIAIKPFTATSDSLNKNASIVLAHSKRKLSFTTRNKIEKWLRIRLNDYTIRFNVFY